jgi:uncharacterized RDD family membrane protein YckC
MKKQILYPNFIIRLLAVMIDLTLISLIITPINYYLNPMMFKVVFFEFLNKNNISFVDAHVIIQLFKDVNFQSQLTLSSSLLFVFLGNLTYIISLLFYLVLTEAKFGTTLGKRLFSIKLVNFKTFEKPSIWQVINRSLFLWLGLILFPMMIFSKQKRGLHDFIAATIVIKR